jgi:hypothetical protein
MIACDGSPFRSSPVWGAVSITAQLKNRTASIPANTIAAQWAASKNGFRWPFQYITGEQCRCYIKLRLRASYYPEPSNYDAGCVPKSSRLLALTKKDALRAAARNGKPRRNSDSIKHRGARWCATALRPTRAAPGLGDTCAALAARGLLRSGHALPFTVTAVWHQRRPGRCVRLAARQNASRGHFRLPVGVRCSGLSWVGCCVSRIRKNMPPRIAQAGTMIRVMNMTPVMRYQRRATA